MNDYYHEKYLKYKNKYLELKMLLGGTSPRTRTTLPSRSGTPSKTNIRTSDQVRQDMINRKEDKRRCDTNNKKITEIKNMSRQKIKKNNDEYKNTIKPLEINFSTDRKSEYLTLKHTSNNNKIKSLLIDRDAKNKIILNEEIKSIKSINQQYPCNTYKK